MIQTNRWFIRFENWKKNWYFKYNTYSNNAMNQTIQWFKQIGDSIEPMIHTVWKFKKFIFQTLHWFEWFDESNDPMIHTNYGTRAITISSHLPSFSWWSPSKLNFWYLLHYFGLTQTSSQRSKQHKLNSSPDSGKKLRTIMSGLSDALGISKDSARVKWLTHSRIIQNMF